MFWLILSLLSQCLALLLKSGHVANFSLKGDKPVKYVTSNKYQWRINFPKLVFHFLLILFH